MKKKCFCAECKKRLSDDELKLSLGEVGKELCFEHFKKYLIREIRWISDFEIDDSGKIMSKKPEELENLNLINWSKYESVTLGDILDSLELVKCIK